MKQLESYAGVPHLKNYSPFNRFLKREARRTASGGQNGLGGFSSFFDVKRLKLRHPVLVTTTDGVGTKLDLARLQGRHDTIGIDLVAMSVNDLITCGAQPILFLDYFAAGAFDAGKVKQVISGIVRGCREAECALLGGETAIMPGFYDRAKYDLAGFSVGVVEKSKILDGRGVRPGDAVLGLESSGFHSNGFSLLRKVFSKSELSGAIGRKLLTPTKIYVKAVKQLLRTVRIDAIAHITGGGFYDNIPRVLPKGSGVEIRRECWPVPELFFEVGMRAGYTDRQMFHTFNMGIGMVAILRASEVERARAVLKRLKMRSWVIGTVIRRKGVTII